MSEIYIGRSFLRDGCYSQHIISAVAKESLIPYNLTQRAPETQNVLYCNTKCHPKLNKTKIKYGSVFLKGNFCFKQTSYGLVV